jgi:hypothetical protein
MKKVVILTLIIGSLYAQGNIDKYFLIVNGAKIEYRAGEYLKSAHLYSKGFELISGNYFTNDYYDAAKAWAMAEEFDSAFYYLSRIYTLKPHSNNNDLKCSNDFASYDFDSLLIEIAFIKLHTDYRWNEIIRLAKVRRSKMDIRLKRELDSIFCSDFENTLRVYSLKNENHPDTIKANSIIDQIHESDALNVQKVVNLINEHGWLCPVVVGEKGSHALARVLLKANLTTQQNYLPIMHNAVLSDNALMEDYVLLKQIVAQNAIK